MGVERVGVAVVMALALVACGEPVREAEPASVPAAVGDDASPGTQAEPEDTPSPSVEGDVADQGTCVPTVVTAESIPEPEGGWSAAALPPARYEEPEDAAPFGLREPAACVEDGRPLLDTWCERREYNWNGALSSITRRPAPGVSRTFETYACGSPGGCSRPQAAELYDARGRLASRRYWDGARDGYIEETWTWAEDGRVERFVDDEQRYGGHQLTTWRLLRACDGRPARYELVSHWGTVQPERPFTYDAQGRLTQEWLPHERTRRAWDSEGRLRAEARLTSSSSSDTETTAYRDPSGQPVMTHIRLNGRMGTSEQWLWDERGPAGEVRASRRLWVYDLSHTSTLTRGAYDAEGRRVLAWSTSRGTYGPRREASRWTYVCGGSDVAAYERDEGGDGTVDFQQAWTWDPRARKVIQRSSHSGSTGWTEYHFDCAR